MRNPDVWFELFIDSHSECQTVRAIWYNNSLHGGTRNECRLTNFGGISSPLLDPENTGALVIFAFERVEGADARDCRVWICHDDMEENFAEGPHRSGRPGTNGHLVTGARQDVGNRPGTDHMLASTE